MYRLLTKTIFYASYLSKKGSTKYFRKPMAKTAKMMGKQKGVNHPRKLAIYFLLSRMRIFSHTPAWPSFPKRFLVFDNQKLKAPFSFHSSRILTCFFFDLNVFERHCAKIHNFFFSNHWSFDLTIGQALASTIPISHQQHRMTNP